MRTLLRPEWLTPDKNFPLPPWQEIQAWVEGSVPSEQHPETWNAIAVEWLQGIAARFSEPMELHLSDHFLLSAPWKYSHASSCLTQLEQYRTRILQLLGVVAGPSWASRCAVIITPSHDDFVSYVMEYSNEGKTSLPGGVYLNRGFGHFVLPNGNLTQHTSILAHELCHALIGPRDMPLWLNEAVTQNIEQQIARQNPYVLDRDLVRKHQAYWTEERMRAFWSGESFSAADEGSPLSYHLARFLLNAITQHGRDLTLQFVLAARCHDAGFSAARSVLEIELSELVSGLLGEGSWGL